MKKLIGLLFLLLSLQGCGFHLQDDLEIPEQFQTMAYQSDDPYGSLSRSIKNILTHHNVKLVGNNIDNHYPTLSILNNELNQDTISIYQDGKSAEYQMILVINAEVNIGKKNHPINIKVFRTFFDNPATALAKSTEQKLIEKEMYDEAARQLISKLKSIDH